MQVEQLLVNPYLYTAGGDIRGDYEFKKGTKVSMEDDADIELAEEEARLQMKSNIDNYLCFRDGETYINLDLEVGGAITASSLDVGNIQMNDLTVAGNTSLKATSIDGKLSITKNTLGESITATGRIVADELMNSQGGLTQAELFHNIQLRAPNLVVTDILYNNAASSTSRIRLQPFYIQMDGQFVYTGSIDFSHLGPADIINWPLADKHIEHLKDIPNGVQVYTDSTHTTEGILEAQGVIAVSGTFQNSTFGIAGAGVVDFTDVDHLNFTGLTAAQIHGWPLIPPQNLVDTATGVRVTNGNNDGILVAQSVSAETGIFEGASFGVNGAGVVEFSEVAQLDFTGLTQAQIVGWPFVHPDGLQNIHDTATGVIVDDDIQVDKIRPNSGTRLDLSDFAEVWVHKLQVDFLEPTTQQTDDILRVNGYDQVRIADDLNVLGNTILGPANVSGQLDGTDAEFSGDVTAENIRSASVGPSDALRTQYVEGAMPYISQVIDANPVTMLMKEDLGIGFTTMRFTSLAARNVMSHLALDNNNNPMRDQFGITPLMTRLYPWNQGFDDSSNYIECYKEDGSNPTAAIRHDGAIWGDRFQFDSTGTTYIRSIPYAMKKFMGFYIEGVPKAQFTDSAVDFYANVYAPNINSSGSFTHCHVCEPDDQATDWESLTGRLIQSTGNCAVRDDNGTLVTDFTQAPSLNHAMTSVRVAETSVLGILNSVELVADGEVEHPHGITLKHKVDESDGHKILRVCSAGDTFVWTVKPVANEIILTPSLLSGLFTKYVNGVEQSEKVVLTCHEDYSFQMIVNVPNVMERLAALETAFAELTNNS